MNLAVWLRHADTKKPALSRLLRMTCVIGAMRSALCPQFRCAFGEVDCSAHQGACRALQRAPARSNRRKVAGVSTAVASSLSALADPAGVGADRATAKRLFLFYVT
jgi:hypothetical protein